MGADRRGVAPHAGAGLVLDQEEGSLLTRFNLAGVLGVADVHVARALARLGGEDDGTVVLAAALAVRAPRAGHVLAELSTLQGTVTAEAVSAATDEGQTEADISSLPWPELSAWLDHLARSPLVATGRRWRGRPASPPHRERSVPGPLLARRTGRGLRPQGPSRGAPAGRGDGGDRRAGPPLPRGRCFGAAASGRQRLGSSLQRHCRRPRDGQDDGHCPPAGLDRGAGRERRRCAAPGGLGRAHGEGSRPHGRGRSP